MKKSKRDPGCRRLLGQTSESLYFSTFQPFPASVLVINTTVSTWIMCVGYYLNNLLIFHEPFNYSMKN